MQAKQHIFLSRKENGLQNNLRSLGVTKTSGRDSIHRRPLVGLFSRRGYLRLFQINTHMLTLKYFDQVLWLLGHTTNDGHPGIGTQRYATCERGTFRVIASNRVWLAVLIIVPEAPFACRPPRLCGGSIQGSGGCPVTQRVAHVVFETQTLHAVAGEVAWINTGRICH